MASLSERRITWPQEHASDQLHYTSWVTTAVSGLVLISIADSSSRGGIAVSVLLSADGARRLRLHLLSLVSLHSVQTFCIACCCRTARISKQLVIYSSCCCCYIHQYISPCLLLLIVVTSACRDRIDNVNEQASYYVIACTPIAVLKEGYDEAVVPSCASLCLL